ncbi:hypothetical protein HPP92_026903 [Vanilla planifolia]|uniref:Uncharacterized protein n=1 Tax=Vanilla planifolia TaxID=51239 RepID=A0A835U778_VANPL|nr:hypothetical protein HPP92_026903 [Vanilla planifolia]
MAPYMEVSIEDWIHFFYLKHGGWPEESHKITQLRRRLPQYVYFNETFSILKKIKKVDEQSKVARPKGKLDQ